MPVDLSIVIPAFDEEERLGPSLETVLSYLEQRGGTYEVIVVDDGSRDGTATVAEGYKARGVRLLRLGENRGKGCALRTGVAASLGEQVLLSDADLSTPIAELERLAVALENAEVVMGSRAVAGSRVEKHQPWYREQMGRTFNRAIRLLGVRGFHDTQCGFKLLRGEAARKLFPSMRIDRFAWDVELVVLAQRAGYRVVEVGVEWHDSPASRVQLWRDGLRMLWDVFKLRLRRG